VGVTDQVLDAFGKCACGGLLWYCYRQQCESTATAAATNMDYRTMPK